MTKLMNLNIIILLLFLTTQINAKTNDINNIKEQTKIIKLYKRWVKNPLNCYIDITTVSFPACYKKDQDFFKCRQNTIKKVAKICEKPTKIAILKTLSKKLTKKEKEKKIIQSIKDYKKELLFFVGYKIGYFKAIQDYKKIEKMKINSKQIKERKK